ncbi:hypothetical protein F2Q70_00020378 [Brassica cretica]|uniref:Uncharacterized protein n=1 Tax=Brassica cretica TaxID=69181 RepID=A0A8S9GND1_BRACR|nr:hypothetical protein F2Q70_00020378 [Brassica cretica]KAF2555204.1 hypothetical protein F2Q68_00013962 [Brassica cretica]
MRPSCIFNLDIFIYSSRGGLLFPFLPSAKFITSREYSIVLRSSCLSLETSHLSSEIDIYLLLRSSIQSRRRELRGRDEGRLADPTRQTVELDCTFRPTRRTGELDGAFGPTRPFGKLDGAFGELDGAFCLDDGAL